MTSEAMTAEQLAVIQRRTNQTSRGPWYVFENDRYLLVRDRDGNAVCRVSDSEFVTPKQQRYAEFIAHARSDIPALVEAVRDAREQRDAFERDYTAVGERNRELHDQLFALHATFLACEQRAGEAEAMQREYEGRFDTARVHLWNARSALVNGASVKDVIAQIGTHLKDIESDRFRATPPRAGEEGPPATATTDAGLRGAAQALLDLVAMMLDDTHSRQRMAHGIMSNYRRDIRLLGEEESQVHEAMLVVRDALSTAPPARRVDELREAEEERLARLREKLASLRDLSARKAIAADKRGEAGDYQTFRSQDAMRLAYGRALSWVDEIFALAPASGAGPGTEVAE